MMGTTVGATKWLLSTVSLRRTSTQMLTMVKTPSSSSAVVPPRTAVASVLALDTK